MRHCITLLLTLLLAQPLLAQLPDDSCAVRYWNYAQSGHQAFPGAAVWLPDSTLFTTAYHGNPETTPGDSNGSAIVVRILDMHGGVLAHREYLEGGWHWNNGGPQALIITQDGNLVMAGNRFDYTLSTSDGLLVKFTPKGDTLWTRRLGTHYQTVLYGIDELANGDLVVAGRQWDGSTDNDVYYAVCDPQGYPRMQKSWGTPGIDVAIDVLAHPEGEGYLFAGYTTAGNPGSAESRYLLFLDTLGNEVWEKKLGKIESLGREFLKGLQKDQDGLPLIFGSGKQYPDSSIGTSWPYLAKINWDGAILWESYIEMYDTSMTILWGYFNQVLPQPDGSHVAVGSISLYSNRWHGLVAKFNPSHEVEWARRHTPFYYYENYLTTVVPRRDEPGFLCYGSGHPREISTYDLWYMWLDPQGKLDTCGHVGVPPPVGGGGLLLYPNPAFDKVTVEMPQGMAPGGSLVVVSPLGQVVETRRLAGAHLQELDVQGWPAGLHQVVVTSPDGLRQVAKLIIVR